jgi:hypothetical protein
MTTIPSFRRRDCVVIGGFAIDTVIPAQAGIQETNEKRWTASELYQNGKINNEIVFIHRMMP